MTHEMKHSLTEDLMLPDHAQRTASALFGRNRRILVNQLDLPCWICGSREAREVHHIVEWSFFNAVDPVKMLDTLHVFDPYGYTLHMGEQAIESPDDIRNLLVLCGGCEIDGVPVAGGHHRGLEAGVHALTFPTWIAQRCIKAGMSITKAIPKVKAADDALAGK